MNEVVSTDCAWRTFSSVGETSGRASMAALNPGRSPATARSYNYRYHPSTKVRSDDCLVHNTYVCNRSLHLQIAYYSIAIMKDLLKITKKKILSCLYI